MCVSTELSCRNVLKKRFVFYGRDRVYAGVSAPSQMECWPLCRFGAGAWSKRTLKTQKFPPETAVRHDNKYD
ncbi:hypothetical protein GCM10011352_08280 [Marinobacterium zhoushanense]|uniref:Uncharacterized protein n=1 Tax=Marinobacterium zhoushanense TaxID=1679163 RepID=A0ABQ1K547_9GAMM|nr:hypothetical protein GCM10011352_08280 [Marinobacterium zhoushanense]